MGGDSPVALGVERATPVHTPERPAWELEQELLLHTISTLQDGLEEKDEQLAQAQAEVARLAAALERALPVPSVETNGTR